MDSKEFASAADGSLDGPLGDGPLGNGGGAAVGVIGNHRFAAWMLSVAFLFVLSVDTLLGVVLRPYLDAGLDTTVWDVLLLILGKSPEHLPLDSWEPMMTAFTWLHDERYELSLDAGYMINTENMATRYVSGNQIHVDWTLAYHVNEGLALGAVGYLFAQTTPDSGPGASLGGFYSSGAGIGPAISCAAPLWGNDFTVETKWLHGLGASHSFLGETVYGSLLLAF